MIQRPRRLRQNKIFRELVRETDLRPHHLIAPLFVKEGISGKVSISAMPGQFQYSVKEIAAAAKKIQSKGIRAVLLFGIPLKKDSRASQAYAKNGIVQRAVEAIKMACPDLLVITDVCLCEYMDHGHCGIVREAGSVKREASEGAIIDNDASVELIAKTALSHAMAGADMVAPSDMMDGRVKAIRGILDYNRFTQIPIMSYAVKYASSFYGPFREAAESAPAFGDRKTYQMDYANVKEALREARLDEEEGADFIIVKPALPCLDIISKVSSQTKLPVVGYQVSGEYAMLVSAFEKGWLKPGEAMLESITAIRRAGARLVITYFAEEIAGTYEEYEE